MDTHLRLKRYSIDGVPKIVPRPHWMGDRLSLSSTAAVAIKMGILTKVDSLLAAFLIDAACRLGGWMPNGWVQSHLRLI